MMKSKKIILFFAIITVAILGCSAGSGIKYQKIKGHITATQGGFDIPDLESAFKYVDSNEKIMLDGGVYQGKGLIQNKSYIIECKKDAICYIIPAGNGITIKSSDVKFINIFFKFRDSSPVATGSFINSLNSQLTFTNCVFKDFKVIPISYVSNGNDFLNIIDTEFNKNINYAVTINNGFLYVRQSIFAENEPYVFRINGPVAGSFISHSTFLNNRGVTEYISPDSNSGLEWYNNIVDFPLSLKYEKNNLVINREEKHKLFFNKNNKRFIPDTGNLSVDSHGIEYGARVTEQGKKRLQNSVKSLLKMQNSISLLKIIAFLKLNKKELNLIKQVFYKRIGSLLIAKKWGIAARDLIVALPFAPDGWYIIDRLKTALIRIFTNIPDKIVITPEQSFPEVEKWLNSFIKKYYTYKTSGRREEVNIEMIDQIKSTTTEKKFEKTISFVNPDYGKLQKAIKIENSKLNILWSKRDKLELRIKGEETKRKIKHIEKPTSYEKLQHRYLDELLVKINASINEKKRLSQKLKKIKKQKTCTFNGTETKIVTKGMFLINKKYYFSPRRVKITLQVKPETECAFSGFLGVWEFPKQENWLSDSLKRFILYKLFFESDFDIIQNLMLQKGVAISDGVDSDTFFKTVIRNYRVFLDPSWFSKVSSSSPSDNRWINVKFDSDGYPKVTVPFYPAPDVEIVKFNLIYNQLINDLHKFWISNFNEPMELFFYELAGIVEPN